MNDITNQFDPTDIEQSKVMAGLSYLGILFFLPLIVCPDSKFGRFHANQSLVLLILTVAVEILFAIILSCTWFIPVVGLVFRILSGLCSIALGVFFLLGLIFGLMGQAKEFPLISKIKILK